MKEQKLREEVSKRRSWVTDATWEFLRNYGFLDEAINEDGEAEEDPVDYLIGKIDDIALASPEPSRRLLRPHRAEEEIFEPSLSPRERERSAALEEYIAWVATADPFVHRFREKVLRGNLLDAEGARTFLAPQRIPSADEGSAKQRIELAFPGEKKADGSRSAFEAILVRRRSVLGELAALSERLCERYRWQPAQAAWFVLTGDVPAAPPVRIRYTSRRSVSSAEGARRRGLTLGVITLEVAPWVSSETLEGAFRSFQRKVLGRRNRSLDEKGLKLLRFVTERLDPVGKLKGDDGAELSELERKDPEAVASLRFLEGPRGRELVKEWDKLEWVKEKPDKRAYGGNTRRFWRDYNRSRVAVAHDPRRGPDFP